MVKVAIFVETKYRVSRFQKSSVILFLKKTGIVLLNKCWFFNFQELDLHLGLTSDVFKIDKQNYVKHDEDFLLKDGFKLCLTGYYVPAFSTFFTQVIVLTEYFLSKNKGKYYYLYISHCGNFRIFLSFRFYVRLILEYQEVLKLPFFEI